ncbi:prepilin peptidase [Actinomycetospora sp. CA-053990]|uniref:prepilin peptidase n=1 Tax=Actinomycetospora sp. CA-053990 TaxID=3239891 RepID=UPI003D8D8925
MVIGTVLAAVLIAVVVAGSAGGLAAVGVRALLARMRRGVLVPVLPTAGALAVLWAVPAAVVAAGLVPATWLPAWLVLGVLVVAGSATDLVARRLPDAVTVPGAVLGLAALVPLGTGHLVSGLLGAAVLGGAFAAVHLAAPGALGAGDVKLAPALGAPLAAASWGGLVAAPVLAAVGVLVLVLAGGARRVPYGPPLLAATWLTLVATVIAR